jgi:tetratricopeptide (TPR) repeat protein
VSRTFRDSQKLPGLTRTAKIACGIFLAIALNSPALSNVRAQFTKANNALQAGQVKVAKRILQKTLKKYPGHQPSNLLLGKIYYREGKIRAAAAKFLLVSPELLDGKSAYPFAISLFTIKRWKRAIAGFSKVPAKSQEINLAYFYKGVAHLRLKNHLKAEVYLKKANPLPANLMASRRRLLKNLRERSNLERSGYYKQSNYQIVPPPPQTYQYSQGYEYPKDPAAKDDPEKARRTRRQPPPPTGLTTVITPSLSFRKLKGRLGKHDIEFYDNDTQILEYKASFVGKYDLRALANGGQPNISLLADFSKKDRTATGEPLTYEYDNGETEEGVSGSENKIELTPAVTYPVTAILDLEGKFKYQLKMPKGDDSKTKMTPEGSSTLELGNHEFKGTAKYVMAEEKNGTYINNDLVMRGDYTASVSPVSFNMFFENKTSDNPKPGKAEESVKAGAGVEKTWETSSMSLDGTIVQYTPPAGKKRLKEQGAFVFTIGGTTSFSFGLSFTAQFEMSLLTEYYAEVPDEFGAAQGKDGETPQIAPAAEGEKAKIPVTVDGTKTRSIVTGTFTPFEWLYMSANWTEISIIFNSPSDPKVQSNFEFATIDYVSFTEFELGVNYTF